jgi:hypothetical protein
MEPVSAISFHTPLLAHKRHDSLLNKVRDNFSHGLNGFYHTDRLTRHDRAVFNIPINDGTSQRTSPEMFNFKLRIFF